MLDALWHVTQDANALDLELAWMLHQCAALCAALYGFIAGSIHIDRGAGGSLWGQSGRLDVVPVVRLTGLITMGVVVNTIFGTLCPMMICYIV